jgi:hypothetical protein
MTPSRCPNCGFASLFLYPSLLSRMRVGVWDTSTLFVQVDLSKAGRWNMAGEPPFFRQRAERSGTSPLRHLLQLEGCLQRTARRRAPCGGCQNISRLPQATEYQEYLAGSETVTSSGPLSKKSEKSPDGGGQARTHRTSQVRPVQPAPPVRTTCARPNRARRASVSCVVHARQVARPVSSRRAARATEPPIARNCGVR